MPQSDVELAARVPTEWAGLLAPQLESPDFVTLASFLEGEYETQTIFPREADLFRALELTKPEKIKVVILGQDPYHGEGQAHGLAFSVQDGTKIPPSLRNLFKELENDLQIPRPDSGNLQSWASQGVLLLNTVLTVREKEPASHAKKGWEAFTDGIIASISAGSSPVVFLLWGGHAKKKRSLVDESRHRVITSAHPSPLSASRGFFGSTPFSKVNEALQELGRSTIDWTL